jgi:hypothetical protein
MIKQKIHLDNYDWDIMMYYAIHGYYVDEIVDNLVDIGIRGDRLEKARELLEGGKVNTGLTYIKDGKAVCVIGKASSAAQYADSIQHEVMHLAVFISIAEGIPLDSEEVCYIGGEIARKAWNKTKLLTSECGCYTWRIGKVL